MARIPILYQDEDLVVIDKPAGVPTHAVEPNDPYPGDAVRIVQKQLGLAYLGMHQRLDAETSGVLLFAAHREANAALAAAFAPGPGREAAEGTGRAVTKVYLALVHGVPRRETGTIDAAIMRERGERYRVTAPNDRRGQRAVTRYRVLKRDPTGRYSLLEVIPETGRSHQIRLHLAHIGAPVVGDALYGPAGMQARGSGSVPRPAAPRLGLHAYQLTLPHPRTGKTMTFMAPPPALFDRIGTGLPELGFTWTPGRGADASPELAALLALAVERRAPLAADPETDIYRLLNGLGDGVGGLVADRYGPALVLSVYAEEDRADGREPLPLTVVEAAGKAAGLDTVYVRYRPRQASRISEEQLAALAPSEPAIGREPGEYVAHEDGLAYLMRPGEGWNAGLFPDMREMRGRVRAWAAGRRVLNCFAYTCGFGVAATAGGAQRVLNLDLSKGVLQRGQANYRANGFEADPHDFVYGDAFDWLGRLARRGDLFDLVILDPPGFARTKTRRFSAAHDYGELAQMAARATAADGLLVACCNVAELPWRAFRERVLSGLAAAERPATVVGVYHAPAIDFPSPPGQESHLKILVARVG